MTGEHLIPHGAFVARDETRRATAVFRWLRRAGERFLQQAFEVVEYEAGVATSSRQEWVDVPIVDEVVGERFTYHDDGEFGEGATMRAVTHNPAEITGLREALFAAEKVPTAEERAEWQTKIEDFRRFVRNRASKLYWRVLEASGMDRGLHRVVIDGYRHGFGEHEFGPASLDEVLREAEKVILSAAPTGTGGEP